MIKKLTELGYKSKKTLIKMFKKENINWKFKKHQLIIDNISIDNFKNLTLIYSFAYNKVSCLEIQFDKNIYNIEQIKDLYIKLYGIPTRDNSKHNLENIIIHWNNNETYINIYDGKKDKYILCNYYYLTKDINKLIPFIISLIGGILWGILFFLFYGLGSSYSWSLFGLSMLGGIIWGLFMGLCMSLMTYYNGKRKLLFINNNDKEKLETFEHENNILQEGYYCIFSKWTKKDFKQFKAKLYIEKEQFVIAFINKRKIELDYKKINSIKRYYLSAERGSISIQFHDSKPIYFSNIDNPDNIIFVIDDMLGYNTQRFIEIEKIIFDNLVKFDPENIIAGGASTDIFSYDAKVLAQQIYNKKEIDVITVKYLLETTVLNSFETFGVDETSCDILTLAINICDDLQKNKLFN